MFIYIDESGDSGYSAGSSKLFVLSAVVFSNKEGVNELNKNIELLREENNWPTLEFHFKRNSEKVRHTFLRTTKKVKLSIFAVMIEKKHRFTKQALYALSISELVKIIDPHVPELHIFIDELGGQLINNEVRRTIRKLLIGKSKNIHIRIENATKNNLLQVADYMASIIHRKQAHQNLKEDYYAEVKKYIIRIQNIPNLSTE